MEVQRIKPDERISADRGLVALRYGPLIYNVERADQSDISGAIGNAPLKSEWKGDLLGGVMLIKGSWANGDALTAIPNYARMNRAGQSEANGGDSGIDYSGGATVGTTVSTNSASSGARPRGPRSGASAVWIKAAAPEGVANSQ